MSEEFLSRRELRARQAASVAPAPEPVLSRRELRAQQAASVAPAPEPVLSRRELRDRESAIQKRLDEMSALAPAAPVSIPEQAMPQQVVIAPVESVAEATAFLKQTVFTDNANPGTIPTQILSRGVSSETNSIVLPSVPDISMSQFAVPDSNIVIRTGAIDLPSQPQPVTGEITLITQPAAVIDASQAEAPEDIDPSRVGVTGINPVPARSLSKKKREKVFPGRLRKGWGTVYLVLGIATLMAAIAIIVFFAYAYKLL